MEKRPTKPPIKQKHRKTNANIIALIESSQLPSGGRDKSYV